ncbi:hypothetical protein [Erythrobacter sp. YT30]|uniref:hypothetical protein n=1 Tax=Erythrobacter sp. YT30 TaxID=1735012 RepID=UPI0012E3AF58|nr:hypothetical protein [Erythrobacter sp. YT30]
MGIFFGGLFYSITQLNLSWSDVQLAPLLFLLLVMGPLTLVYSGINMQLMAKAISVRIGFLHSIKVSAYAQVAELLPLPGGAIVRTAALMKEGASTRESATIVAGLALLWISCAAVGGGVALLSVRLVGEFLLVFGLVTVIATVFWLAKVANWSIALYALGLRALGLLLVASRITIAFLVLNVTIDPIDALAFGFAIILGSAAAIAPAGLGIGEALSALMAEPNGVAATAAFSAAAINRLAGFAVNMISILFVSGFRFRLAMPGGPNDE